MLSPLEVYLLFQMDSFVGMAITVAIFSFLISIPLFLTGGCFKENVDEEHSDYRSGVQLQAMAKKLATVALVAALIATLLPSSRTLAAMCILPAITSKEVMEPVGKEAKEIYNLAKDALSHLAEKPPEEK